MTRKILILIFLLAPFCVIYASDSFTDPPEKYKTISVEELRDKIAGAWIGQMIGNIYGLPHENKYIDAPGKENWPYGYTKNLDKLKQYNGAFSDDDTDVEYMYVINMEKYGVEPTYQQMREAWMYHIRDRVWLANRATLGLMHYGYTPPFTGSKKVNPHWFQIDPQLINEIWAYTAPGMIDYAAQKSDWAARVTSDDWGTEPTIHYGAMYSAAFFENDINKLIQIGLDALPENGRYAQTVRDMIALHKKHKVWQDAWKEMALKYYINEPNLTKTIWNANLNGAAGILAMLYGEGNFQRTLDLSCAMGFDADNQAATVAGILGVISGLKGLPKDLYLPIEGWEKPFNDTYINITRFELPDASINNIIDRTVDLSLKLIEQKGGSVSKGKNRVAKINTTAQFEAPIEFYIGPPAKMEINQPIDFTFYSDANKNYNWSLLDGKVPEGTSIDKGRLTGKPKVAGIYPITMQVANGKKQLTKKFNLLVKGENLAKKADSIIANIQNVNMTVLDSCWTTFGNTMYAKTPAILNDGIFNGPNSVFYSIAEASILPKVDYYGYGWKTPQTMDMVVFNTGGMEEFGGWFTSLNVQYLNNEGKWVSVENQDTNPKLPETDIIFFQPHFAEYILTFKPVATKAIRIIGDAKVQDHWNKYTKKVSAFTSISELSVHNSKK